MQVLKTPLFSLNLAQRVMFLFFLLTKYGCSIGLIGLVLKHTTEARIVLGKIFRIAKLTPLRRPVAKKYTQPRSIFLFSQVLTNGPRDPLTTLTNRVRKVKTARTFTTHHPLFYNHFFLTPRGKQRHCFFITGSLILPHYWEVNPSWKKINRTPLTVKALKNFGYNRIRRSAFTGITKNTLTSSFYTPAGLLTSTPFSSFFFVFKAGLLKNTHPRLSFQQKKPYLFLNNRSIPTITNTSLIPRLVLWLKLYTKSFLNIRRDRTAHADSNSFSYFLPHGFPRLVPTPTLGFNSLMKRPTTPLFKQKIFYPGRFFFYTRFYLGKVKIRLGKTVFLNNLSTAKHSSRFNTFRLKKLFIANLITAVSIQLTVLLPSFRKALLKVQHFTFHSKKFFFRNRPRIGIYDSTYLLTIKPYHDTTWASTLGQNLKKIALLPRDFPLFKFCFYGFVFVSDSRLGHLEHVHALKKNFYSFPRKNDLQRFIIRRYLKPTHAALNTQSVFCFRSLPLHKKEVFFASTFNSHTLTSLNYLTQILSATTPERGWVQRCEEWRLFNHSTAEAYNLNLKRVKFKPGYATLWREARQVLKDLTGVNFRYQHRLTSFILKYTRLNQARVLLLTEMRLQNILLRSRLVPDKTLCLLYVFNHTVYLNGFLCSNPEYYTVTGDLIQLLVSVKYYILYRWFLNWTLKKKIRLRIKAQKLSSGNSFEEKQRGKLLPRWVLFNKNLSDDVLKYTEVDFFSLSVFILYEPFRWTDLNPYLFFENRFFIINLFNWKYIT